MFNGQCTGVFARSVAELVAACLYRSVRLELNFRANDSLIPRARNHLCDEFLQSGATHLLFIDADIGFRPNDVMMMLELMSRNGPYAVVAAPYPNKSINWVNVKLAVERGVPATELDRYIADFVVSGGVITPGKPSEVEAAGTGYMMIHRHTLERFAEAYPEYSYRPFAGQDRRIHQFFQAEINLDGHYMSEDWWFCHKVRELGMKVWLCPWMSASHVGTLEFSGALTDLASIGGQVNTSP